MTIEIPVPEGPPCDFCADWPAVGSLMNLADYTTQKFCASCGAQFLLGIVQAMSGADAASPAPAPDAPTPAAAAAVAEHLADPNVAGPEDDDGTGSAADHWASTAHVRRSTHGHRTARGASGVPDRPPADE